MYCYPTDSNGYVKIKSEELKKLLDEVYYMGKNANKPFYWDFPRVEVQPLTQKDTIVHNGMSPTVTISTTDFEDKSMVTHATINDDGGSIANEIMREKKCSNLK